MNMSEMGLVVRPAAKEDITAQERIVRRNAGAIRKRKAELKAAMQAYETHRDMDHWIHMTHLKGEIASREKLLRYQKMSLETIRGRCASGDR